MSVVAERELAGKRDYNFIPQCKMQVSGHLSVGEINMKF